MVTDQDAGLLPRCRERRVFLFEQIVIFSEPLDKKKGFSTPGFLFKNSIKVRCRALPRGPAPAHRSTGWLLPWRVLYCTCSRSVYSSRELRGRLGMWLFDQSRELTLCRSFVHSAGPLCAVLSWPAGQPVPWGGLLPDSRERQRNC